MIRKLIVVVAICALGGFAQAEWLYWTLNFTKGRAPWSEGDDTPKTAWLVARDEGGNTTICSSLIGGSESKPVTDSTDLSALWGKVPVSLTSDLDGLSSSYYFYVELGNTLGEATWVSSGMPYTDAENAGHIAATAMQAVTLTAWTPTDWMAPGDVPEPTSGLLVLTGMGLLALRRRRKDADA